MAAVQAARVAPERRVVLVDGAPKLGAKLLVSGGGRCNVTHERVVADDFAGGSRNTIRKILGRFGVEDTVQFFAERGVSLKREDSGKLFPTTDSAQTVLDALIGAAEEAGVEILNPFRIQKIEPCDGGFRLHSQSGDLEAKLVILATGGKSLPRTGSDGIGYTLARELGHRITERMLPALVPLLLPGDDPLIKLSGLSTPATLTVTAKSGKKLESATGSLLCTHFGLSGPVVLDISRYFIDATLDDADTSLVCNWLPAESQETLDELLRAPGAQTPFGRLRRKLPERLVRTLFEHVGVQTETRPDQLTRSDRTALVKSTTAWPLAVRGTRGWNFAEVTAGGIPLDEIVPATMQSRICPGLYLCGEICDVDGRIGGFNFQWAWTSGAVAGRAAGLSPAAAAK